MDPTSSFVMALAALVLTVANITATVVNFRKSAGHVVVEMNAALLNPTRSLLSNDKGTWGLLLGEYRSTGFELAKIVIENPGRTAATITQLDLRVTGSSNPAFAMGVKAITVKKLSETLGGVTTSEGLPYRLEPFDQAVYLVDFWAVVRHVFTQEPHLREINVWVSVKIAGQPRPYDSKSHGYWTIRREWVSFVSPYTQRSAHSIILAELMNVFDDPGEIRWLPQLASRIEQKITPESDPIDITSVLQEIIGPGWDSGGSSLGPHDVWRLMFFGDEVKQRLDAIGKNVIWDPTPDTHH
ncbi:hypothetical protein [Paenarthrobacter histidinolovorans]|uniref:hypothetical protein n=1 Tax=Paenarthrobacter histidinolovorans TaxID=43664 RepID=UPI00166D2A50|nr:hypothetical protein [Paenarthrobacter histidinolovorans]GGJ20424.1 hypothetical protein GCM10010052_17180 [Paenarthrobacter histidinolovorans]